MLMRRAIFGVIVAVTINCLVYGQAANAQGSNSPFQSRLTLQNNGVNADLTIHHDALNRPCLDIEAATRRHIINPDVYDHIVSVYNRCLTLIKLHVCYSKSDHCIDMEVPGRQRKDGVLGIYPHIQYFSYSYREKF